MVYIPFLYFTNLKTSLISVRLRPCSLGFLSIRRAWPVLTQSSYISSFCSAGLGLLIRNRKHCRHTCGLPANLFPLCSLARTTSSGPPSSKYLSICASMAPYFGDQDIPSVIDDLSAMCVLCMPVVGFTCLTFAIGFDMKVPNERTPLSF